MNKDAFLRIIQTKNYSAIFITGDIANDNITDTMRELATHTTFPIYFVLGNIEQFPCCSLSVHELR